MAGLRDDENPDFLLIKRTAEPQYRFHYSRAERLNMKNSDSSPETRKRQRIRKITKYVYIVLAVAILALMAIIMIRIFA